MPDRVGTDCPSIRISRINRVMRPSSLLNGSYSHPAADRENARKVLRNGTVLSRNLAARAGLEVSRRPELIAAFPRPFSAPSILGNRVIERSRQSPYLRTFSTQDPLECRCLTYIRSPSQPAVELPTNRQQSSQAPGTIGSSSPDQARPPGDCGIIKKALLDPCQSSSCQILLRPYKSRSHL